MKNTLHSPIQIGYEYNEFKYIGIITNPRVKHKISKNTQIIPKKFKNNSSASITTNEEWIYYHRICMAKLH